MIQIISIDGETKMGKTFKDLKKNAHGYSDPTAYEAIKNMDKDYERFRKLLHMIFYICHISGFQLEGRITLRDKWTGKVWR